MSITKADIQAIWSEVEENLTKHKEDGNLSEPAYALFSKALRCKDKRTELYNAVSVSLSTGTPLYANLPLALQTALLLPYETPETATMRISNTMKVSLNHCCSNENDLTILHHASEALRAAEQAEEARKKTAIKNTIKAQTLVCSVLMTPLMLAVGTYEVTNMAMQSTGLLQSDPVTQTTVAIVSAFAAAKFFTKPINRELSRAILPREYLNTKKTAMYFQRAQKHLEALQA